MHRASEIFKSGEDLTLKCTDARYIYANMANKTKTVFICQSCGREHPKWQGRCDGCSEWNTLVEEVVEKRPASSFSTFSSSRPVPLSEADSTAGNRVESGFGEFDRVLGGGIVPGSVVLLSGEPGIGKSTILLQIAMKLSERSVKSFYVTAEESPGQIKMRAERLSASGTVDNIMLLAENTVETVLANTDDSDILIVDSIQAMASLEITGTPGNIGQVRHSTSILVDYAKRNGKTVLIVGHVTKSGNIAGPKVLEHAVDVVLTMEGDRQSELRLLRATKNRFGATGEIGVFSMGEAGFAEVENPSAAFIAQHEHPVPGSVIFAGMEGQRPLFVEIQALAAPAAYGTPQRVAQGIDYRRLILLAAILERRAGMPLSRYDLFVNVVGGVDISERSADIAVMLAIVSSLRDIPVKPEIAVLGEVGLTGELRRVRRTAARLKEAERLGFKGVILPKTSEKIPRKKNLQLFSVGEIYSAFNIALGKKKADV